MKIILAALFSLTVFSHINAQYYYSDIIGNQLTNQQYKLIRTNKLNKISATSYEGNQPSTDFVLEQTISNSGDQITTRSASVGNGESFFISRYNNNKVEKTVDSSSNAINTVSYEYDAQGRLSTTRSSNKDFDGTFSSTEDHLWSYNAKGLPEKMVKIKNATDTTHVIFKYDETGNIAEEVWKKNNRVLETYYYYYNSKNQLTDIVRFSLKAKQMLPDYIFEYDDNGRIVQMTQAQKNSANYLIWKYSYNTLGLKEKEVVFNKKKEYLGKIEYNYQ